MKQYIAFIRSSGDPLATLSPAEQESHIEATKAFVGNLFQRGIMQAALPVEMEGQYLRGSHGQVTASAFSANSDPIAGFYLFKAEDLQSAVTIVKSDPRFGGEAQWSMEIRPILAIPGISD